MTLAADQDTFGIYDAKTNFASLVERVISGETLTITKHGKPVATISPIEKAVPELGELIEKLDEARSLLRLGKNDYRKLIGRDNH